MTWEGDKLHIGKVELAVKHSLILQPSHYVKLNDVLEVLNGKQITWYPSGTTYVDGTDIIIYVSDAIRMILTAKEI